MGKIKAPLTSFLDEAAKLLPAGSLLLAEEDFKHYGTDWTKTGPCNPCAVALPRTTEQVADLLSLCSKHGVAVVPSGGRTGLAGGAAAIRGELVLSFEKMRTLGPVDLVTRTVRVQAGATTQAVHEHCAPSGLTWPIDLAAKGSSQIGGNLATNAGGVHVIRYGMARKWVLSLQAVTMQGEIIETNGDLEKNNTGFDLTQLLIGSEGTLAVITEATLKLAPLPSNLQVFFFAVRDFESVLGLFEASRKGPFELSAFEFLSSNCLTAVGEKLNRRSKLTTSAPYYVLVEVDHRSTDDGLPSLDSWLQSLFESDLVSDGALARSSEEARHLWELREGVSESLSLKAPLRKFDVSLPVRKMSAWMSKLEELLRNAMAVEVFLFGHLGDGNLHLNLLKPDSVALPEFLKECARLEPGIFELIQDHSGSISAEHGIGLLKKKWLSYSRHPLEIELFRGIKKAFDPQRLLNPGKIFE